MAWFVSLLVALQVYAPSLSGPFLFDDDYLPFNAPNFPTALSYWVAGVRPLLMFTYWINYRASGLATTSYHFINLVFHASAAVLVYLFLRKILEYAAVNRDKLTALSLFGAAIFLLHPAQSESVAYVASRSENLSGVLFLAALVVYLYRRSEEISWLQSAAVLLLFGAALASKEHTLVLPAILLLTDYYWNPGFSWTGARRNWRFYLPVAGGSLLGCAFVWRVIAVSKSAGFGMKNLTWYQYFFTECRAFFVYLRLFVLPVGQTVDYDFAISRGILEHGAIFSLLGMLLIAGGALYLRKRYPLASYGFLFFFIVMAPTSSFVPLKDPVAEHRLYLPIIGLLLVAIEFLSRLQVSRKNLGLSFCAIAVLAGILTYQRNQVWSDPISLWTDTVQKSPRLPRAHFQLGYAYYAEHECGKALNQYEAVARLQQPSYDLLVDWGLAYDCLNRYDEALVQLQRAAAIERTAHIYSQIAMVYAKQSKWAEALAALQSAQKLDPAYAMTYVYRGHIHLKTGDPRSAVEDYGQALRLNPRNVQASEGLATAERMLAGRR